MPKDTIAAELLKAGVAHHKAGRRTEAEACYRKVLAVVPDHADALHLLGVLAYQGGRSDLAVDLIRSALRQNEQNAAYLCNLGAALREQGSVDEAVEVCRRAVRAQPQFAEAHCALGAALRDQGKLDQSVASSRLAIRHDPKCADAYHNLACALRDLGQAKESLKAFRQAIQIRPAAAQLYFDLGVALQEFGNLPQAIEAYRHAIKLKPDFAAAFSNLGVALRDQGRLDEAVGTCREAVRLRPDLAVVHCNLGAALRDLGRPEEAVVECREAIRLDPRLALAHSTLGVALRDQDNIEEAIAAQEEAIRIDPGLALAHCNLGATLTYQGKLEEAVVAYREAGALNTKYDAAFGNLGQALIQLGRLSEGRTALLEAIRIAPWKMQYRRHLAELSRFVPDDPGLVELERWWHEREKLPAEDQIELHFALGKAYEDLGQHATAFRYLSEGNSLKRRQIRYHEATTLQLFDRIRAVFTPERIEKWAHAGHPSSLPIFVIGMPRSGTTLVEQILASHPQVFGAGELKDLEQALKATSGALDSSTSFPEAALVMKSSDFAELGTRYVARIRRLAPSAQRIVDKMPHNFMTAGLIHVALPKAHIIHVVRDPIDTCVSCFSKLFADEQNHTYDLAELGRYYRRYQKLMSYWKSVLPSGRILELRYEDVVADLEEQARRIIAHCELEWDDHCLSFHKTARPIRTASAVQVRQPIYKNAVGRWRVYEPFLGPLLAELG